MPKDSLFRWKFNDDLTQNFIFVNIFWNLYTADKS